MELYIDDIVIYGKTPQECLEKLMIIFEVAAQYDLKFRWQKCKFLKNKIDFLGHSIENGTILPGKEKVRAIDKFPYPRNLKDVQSFLGLTGYFRKFVSGYAQIASPLTNLLRKNIPFEIGENEKCAIEQLKSKLTKEPVLHLYDRQAETELHTDASMDGFGATLLQRHDNKLHPVFFWSKKTSSVESQQHSYILEVKAAYLALKKFRHYLLGLQFKLVTDCSAFKHTMNKKDLPRSVAQWVMYTQDFTFTVEHRAAVRMKHVDSLSRYPVELLLISSELTSRFQKAQLQDECIRAITVALQTGSYGGFKMKGGLLYKCVKGQELLFTPKLMEFEIIKDAHEKGHFGMQKTMHIIEQQFFIPHLDRKVNKVVNNCVRCIVHNKKLGKKEGMLQVIDKGDTPLCTLHIDHLGPMDATTKKYKYILAMTDAFSKFIWLFPTKTTSTEEVVAKLAVWVDTYGYPQRIISDRGAAFTSKSFEEFCKEGNVEHILITTGVPRGNGQIERSNRTILAVIAKLSADDTTKWFKYVGQVQKAINSSIHSSTKASPFEIIFGTKMNTSMSSRISDILQQEFFERFDEERQKLRNDAKQQIQKAQKQQKQQHDKRCKEATQYVVGDIVAIKRTQFVAGKKLANEYLGPYIVNKVKRNDRYEVVKHGKFEGPGNTSSSADNMKMWKTIEGDDVLLSSGSDDEQDGRL
uniref:RNA-directed DNA polymerase n=1 Tax=Ceratitis capitata TaxID=7213 RepID=W8CD04_CERCA